MKNAIEVRDLRKAFTTKQKEAGLAGSLKSVFKPNFREVVAVDDISFDIKKGELLAFIGPNGAGKSTTIKIMTGILFPTSGEVDVLGFTPWKDREKLAYHIGSVFGQKPQLWFHLPPIDTFNLLSKIYELDKKEYEERLAKLVKLFEVESIINTPARKLSLGQRMRCELIASLLHRPEIVFLDEPTIGIDIVAKQKMRDLIKELNRKEKTTIFLTSHDAGDIEELCKRVIIINNGKIVFDDTVSKLRKNYLQTKQIVVKLAKQVKGFRFEGCKIVKRAGYSMTIELDTTKRPVSELMKHISKEFEVKDITVSDPPIEEIISKIYQAGK